jgi:hypothetical protein
VVFVAQPLKVAVGISPTVYQSNNVIEHIEQPYHTIFATNTAQRISHSKSLYSLHSSPAPKTHFLGCAAVHAAAFG